MVIVSFELYLMVPVLMILTYFQGQRWQKDQNESCILRVLIKLSSELLL